MIKQFSFFFLTLVQTSLVFGLLKKLDGRIVGGEQAKAGEFPYAAAITVHTSIARHFCGGTLLHPRWVLTAGQCVDGATLFTIIVGTTKRDGSETTAQRVATDTYFLHPEFDPLTLDNDIALVRFREELRFNEWTGTAYLPFFETVSGDIGLVFGWGQLDDSEAGLVNDLHWISLSVLSQEECKAYYGNQIRENMFCAKGENNEGICLGDSGSPNIVQMSRGYSFPVGLAIFTSGNGCESTEPSGFLKVYPYVDWLRNVTNEIL